MALTFLFVGLAAVQLSPPSSKLRFKKSEPFKSTDHLFLLAFSVVLSVVLIELCNCNVQVHLQIKVCLPRQLLMDRQRSGLLGLGEVRFRCRHRNLSFERSHFFKSSHLSFSFQGLGLANRTFWRICVKTSLGHLNSKWSRQGQSFLFRIKIPWVSRRNCRRFFFH